MKSLRTIAICGMIINLSAACTANKAQKFTGTKKPQSTSEEIAEVLQQPSNAVLIQRLRDSTWRELYEVVIKIANDDSFTIDGLNFDGVLRATYDMETQIDVLEDRFGTLGEYIDQTDIPLPTSTTKASFKEAMEKTHEYFQGEEEWADIKPVFETGDFDDFVATSIDDDPFADPLGGSDGSSMSTPDQDDAKAAICDGEGWKSGQDPSVLGNIAACARGLTALKGDGFKNKGGDTGFGINLETYLNNACSALFVLTTASAAASLVENSGGCGE